MGLAEEGSLERKCHWSVNPLLVFVFAYLESFFPRERTLDPGLLELSLLVLEGSAISFSPLVTKRCPAPTHLDCFLKEGLGRKQPAGEWDFLLSPFTRMGSNFRISPLPTSLFSPASAFLGIAVGYSLSSVGFE